MSGILASISPSHSSSGRTVDRNGCVHSRWQVDLVTGGRGGAQLWDATDGRPIGPRSGISLCGAAATTMALRPDGKKTATTGIDKAGSFGRCHRVCRRRQTLLHPEPVESVAFSPDCKLTLTGCGGDDRTVRVWDEAQGRSRAVPCRTPTTSSRGVQSGRRRAPRCLPNGHCAVVGPRDLLPQRKSYPHPGCVSAATFSPDGRSFYWLRRRDSTALGRGNRGVFPSPPSASGLGVRRGFQPRRQDRAHRAERTRCARLWDRATGQPISAQVVSIPPRYGQLPSPRMASRS